MLSFFLSVLESEADKQKFTEIYEQNHVRMEQVAISLLKNQHDAEDAVQNSFVQIIRHFRKLLKIPCEEVPFWIIAIVKNEARMVLRKKKKVVMVEEIDYFEESIDAHISYTELVDLVAKLPDVYRAVLEMKALLGYSDKEIAEKLGISETAVSSRATRARAILRKIADREGFEV